MSKNITQDNIITKLMTITSQLGFIMYCLSICLSFIKGWNCPNWLYSSKSRLACLEFSGRKSRNRSKAYSKMQVLSLSHRILVILGLCIKNRQNPNYGRLINVVIFILLTCFLMITFDYILSHFDDRANALYAIMQFITFATVWTCYVSFANQKHITFEFLNEMQEIVDRYRKYAKILFKCLIKYEQHLRR